MNVPVKFCFKRREVCQYQVLLYAKMPEGTTYRQGGWQEWPLRQVTKQTRMGMWLLHLYPIYKHIAVCSRPSAEYTLQHSRLAGTIAPQQAGNGTLARRYSAARNDLPAIYFNEYILGSELICVYCIVCVIHSIRENVPRSARSQVANNCLRETCRL